MRIKVIYTRPAREPAYVYRDRVRMRTLAMGNKKAYWFAVATEVVLALALPALLLAAILAAFR